MKNKKGFTLIELLAVIVILAIIALIAVPTIMNVLNKANKSAFKDTAYGIISAGELYFAEQQLEPNGMSSNASFVWPEDIGTLQVKGNVPDGTKLHVNTNGETALAMSNGRYCVIKGYSDKDITITEEFTECNIPGFVTDVVLSKETVELDVTANPTMTVTATITPSDALEPTLVWKSSDENVAVVENGTITAVSVGKATITVSTTDGSGIVKKIEVDVKHTYTTTNNVMKSYDKCIIEGTCSVGTEVSVKVKQSTWYDFNVLSDDGNKITLIMNTNLQLYGYPNNRNVPWLDQTDYVAAGGANWGSGTDENGYGPLTALKVLKEFTSDWLNIPAYTYTLDYETGTYSGEYVQNVRARLPKLSDITTESIGCKQGNTATCPDWIYQYLYGTGDNATRGYWLSDAPGGAWKVALFVEYDGKVTAANTSANSFGLRPVIILSK